MSFPSTVICFTFIPLSLFFWVLAPISPPPLLRISLWFTWMNMFGSQLQIAHIKITSSLNSQTKFTSSQLQDRFSSSPSLCDPCWVPRAIDKEVRASPTLGSLAYAHDGERHPWPSVPKTLDQCQKTWTVSCNPSSPHLLGNEWKWAEHKGTKQMVGRIPYWMLSRELHEAEALAPTVSGLRASCQQLDTRERTTSWWILVRSYQPWKMTMANICELLWVFNILLPCSNPCRQEGQGVITQSDRWGNCKIWRGWEICRHPQYLGGGGKVECPALGSSVFGNFKLTVRSSIIKCWATTCPEADAGLDAGGVTHTSITHELWPPWAQKTLQYFVQGPEGVGQPLSTRANERRGRRRILPVRGRAWAGCKVWGTGVREMGVGVEGWEGTGVSGDQGEENRMERVAVTSLDQVKEETE